MKKVILNLKNISSRDELHDILHEAFEFPDWYGRNLDALFDLLTETSEDICVGLFLPDLNRMQEMVLSGEAGYDEAFISYLEHLHDTFIDAENANPHICVIFPPADD